ncbi:hypothetical protein B0H16DRAFT_264302 [Mycena metata]|uniref:Uncharacterized protein n=1 Tax=Mycena metata TaxID=1033252 RepID=A0AAD7MPB1_9AGAR|nr:hypothetical protein B0H16DRAFT_264302 [Mycena metata]
MPNLVLPPVNPSASFPHAFTRAQAPASSPRLARFPPHRPRLPRVESHAQIPSIPPPANRALLSPALSSARLKGASWALNRRCVALPPFPFTYSLASPPRCAACADNRQWGLGRSLILLRIVPFPTPCTPTSRAGAPAVEFTQIPVPVPTAAVRLHTAAACVRGRRALQSSRTPVTREPAHVTAASCHRISPSSSPPPSFLPPFSSLFASHTPSLVSRRCRRRSPRLPLYTAAQRTTHPHPVECTAVESTRILRAPLSHRCSAPSGHTTAAACVRGRRTLRVPAYAHTRSRGFLPSHVPLPVSIPLLSLSFPRPLLPRSHRSPLARLTASPSPFPASARVYTAATTPPRRLART